MKEEILNVEGINCDHCVNKIKRFVGELQGVMNVDVDLKDKSVKVKFSDPAHIDEIKEAILDAGFEVT